MRRRRCWFDSADGGIGAESHCRRVSEVLKIDYNPTFDAVLHPPINNVALLRPACLDVWAVADTHRFIRCPRLLLTSDRLPDSRVHCALRLFQCSIQKMKLDYRDNGIRYSSNRYRQAQPESGLKVRPKAAKPKNIMYCVLFFGGSGYAVTQ